MLPIERLGQMLQWKEAVKALFIAVEDVVLERLSAGEVVPGWKLVDGREEQQRECQRGARALVAIPAHKMSRFITGGTRTGAPREQGADGCTPPLLHHLHSLQLVVVPCKRLGLMVSV